MRCVRTVVGGAPESRGNPTDRPLRPTSEALHAPHRDDARPPWVGVFRAKAAPGRHSKRLCRHRSSLPPRSDGDAHWGCRAAPPAHHPSHGLISVPPVAERDPVRRGCLQTTTGTPCVSSVPSGAGIADSASAASGLSCRGRPAGHESQPDDGGRPPDRAGLPHSTSAHPNRRGSGSLSSRKPSPHPPGGRVSPSAAIPGLTHH